MMMKSIVNIISCLNVSPICVKSFEAGKSSLVVPDFKSLKTDVVIQSEDIFRSIQDMPIAWAFQTLTLFPVG